MSKDMLLKIFLYSLPIYDFSCKNYSKKLFASEKILHNEFSVYFMKIVVHEMT